MDINTKDGNINKFLSIEYTAMTSSQVPVFKTYGAVYYDKQDSFDNLQYIYQAFLMNDKVEMLRMQVKSTNPVIDWSYEFYEFTEA